MKKYLYVILSNSSGKRYVLGNNPVGWDTKKINIIRDLVYYGMLKNISVEFEFVGDGYECLQQEYLRFGADVDLLLRVYNTTTNTFEVEGKINLENFNDDRTNRRFRVDIIESAIMQKFNNREDIDLNLFNTISLDQTPVPAAPYRLATFRGKKILFESTFDGVAVDSPDIYAHILPFKIAKNGNPYVKQGSGIELNLEWEDHFDLPGLRIKEYAHFVNDLPTTQTIGIDFEVEANLTWKGHSGTYPNMFFDFKVYIVNPDLSVASTPFLHRVNFDGPYNVSQYVSFEYSASLAVQPGQWVIICMERNAIAPPFTGPTEENLGGDLLDDDGAGFKCEVQYNRMVMTITQESTFPESTAPVILPYELFDTLCSQIVGKAGSFYSPIFGRTDLGYAANGKGALTAVTRGILLRGVALSEVQFITSFKDAFVSYNSLYNLAAYISQDQIVIDSKDAVFTNQIVVNAGEVSNLNVGTAKDFLFNSIKAGFPLSEYEEENGMDEFNTVAQYTNSYRGVKKELDLTSVYNGDGYGIEFARRLSIDKTGSQDTKYDDTIFFVDLFDDAGVLKTRQMEGIDLVEGIYSPETAMNLRISIGQNLLRWKKFLNIPLHRKSKVCFFQSKKKNSTLKINTLEEGYSADREDLLLGEASYFIPEEKKFEVVFTINQVFDIIKNPFGLIKYTHKGETFFDLLFEVDNETEKNITQARVLSTRPSPVQVIEGQSGPYVMHNESEEDLVLHGMSIDDFVIYTEEE